METISLYKHRKDALDEGKRQLYSKFSEGHERRLEEGFERGREETTYQNIVNVLKFMTDEQIASSFNKSLDYVREIRRQFNI